MAKGLQDAIERHGPESILPYYYAGTMGYIQGWTLGPRLFRHLGASQLHTNLCSAAAHAACDATLGAAVGYDPEDVVDAKLVILWGTNPLNANLHMWKFVLEARARGAHLVAVDPIRSESAARCDEHIAPLPGTDAALALGLMRTVLDEGAADIDWLERHTVGWPELEARLAESARRAGGGGLRARRRRRPRARPAAGPHETDGDPARARHAAPRRRRRRHPCRPRHPGGDGGLAARRRRRVSLTSDHFPFPVASVVSPPDLPAPPARTVNMSRLGEALTETATRPSRRWWSSTRTRPRATRTRCACGAAWRATISSPSCSSSASPTQRTSPTSSCPSRCSRSTTTSTAPTVICTSNGTSRPSSPRARPSQHGRLSRDREVDGPRASPAVRLGPRAGRAAARRRRLAGSRRHARRASRAGMDARRRLRARDGAVRPRRLPERIGEGRAGLGGARPRGPGPARRLRASPRGARPGAGRAVPARPHGAGRKVLPQLDVRLDRLAPEQDGPGHRAPPPRRTPRRAASPTETESASATTAAPSSARCA